MNALDKLIEAVEAGTLQQPARVGDHKDDWLLHPLLELVPSGVWHVHQMREMVLAYNGDLNAALALHEALLPNWSVNMMFQKFHPKNKQKPTGEWEVGLRLTLPTRYDYASACADGFARAWLLAILRAYRAQQGES